MGVDMLSYVGGNKPAAHYLTDYLEDYTMARFDNNSALAVVPVSEVKPGTYVRKIKVCAACNGDGATDNGPCNKCETRGYTEQAKTYIRGEYCRSARKYSLTDDADMNREVWLKGTARVLVGFTY